jgi:hypothetical protein
MQGKRLNIYLTRECFDALKKASIKSCVPMAKIIRRSIATLDAVVNKDVWSEDRTNGKQTKLIFV